MYTYVHICVYACLIPISEYNYVLIDNSAIPYVLLHVSILIKVTKRVWPKS